MRAAATTGAESRRTSLNSSLSRSEAPWFLDGNGTIALLFAVFTTSQPVNADARRIEMLFITPDVTLLTDGVVVLDQTSYPIFATIPAKTPAAPIVRSPLTPLTRSSCLAGCGGDGGVRPTDIY